MASSTKFSPVEASRLLVPHNICFERALLNTV
uniref:Uncharacterized protein n=1 Tax=Tetraselmis sp. GSL018 TaxID=582737 RepID=A0A061RJ29_9CHLO